MLIFDLFLVFSNKCFFFSSISGISLFFFSWNFSSPSSRGGACFASNLRSGWRSSVFLLIFVVHGPVHPFLVTSSSSRSSSRWICRWSWPYFVENLHDHCLAWTTVMILLGKTTELNQPFRVQKVLFLGVHWHVTSFFFFSFNPWDEQVTNDYDITDWYRQLHPFFSSTPLMDSFSRFVSVVHSFPTQFLSDM